MARREGRVLAHFRPAAAQYANAVLDERLRREIMYHDGSRLLQDRFDSRRIADRLFDVLHRTEFSDDDRDFIDNSIMFFLATADAAGQPDCSYKGGRPGFVRVVSPDTLAFPSYDGNGMYRSMGKDQQSESVLAARVVDDIRPAHRKSRRCRADAGPAARRARPPPSSRHRVVKTRRTRPR